MKYASMLCFALAAGTLSCLAGDSESTGEEPIAADAQALVDEVPITTTTPNGPCTHSITFENELLMVAPWIVDDARAEGLGPWSFGRLMTNLAGAHSPTKLVRKWLATWEDDVTFTPPGGKPEKVRGNARNVHDAFIDRWPRDGGELDLAKAPFRLLAIVFRPDLEDTSKHSGGEVRLIFGATGPKGTPLPMTVAFEYRVPAATHQDAVAFAKFWYGALAPIADANTAAKRSAYLAKLEQLTNAVTATGADPAAVNGSALAQLRTNEVVIDTPWDLRQFGLNAAGDALELQATPGVPLLALNGTAELANLVNGSGVPLSKETATARMPSAEWFWRPMPNVTSHARHDFAMTTCNGCHSAETGTKFLQIAPRVAGKRSVLSSFLSKPGTVVKDPVTDNPRTFDEPTRRMQKMNDLLCE